MGSVALEAEHGVSDKSLGDGAPLLAVIVPVYNEAATIEESLRRVLDAVPVEKQVVVVDDGSTDGTWERVCRGKDRGLVEVVRHDQNRGKGAAIRTGLELARGRFTIIQDADLEYDPRDYERLLEPLITNEAQAVYGSRYLSAEGRQRGRWRVLRFGVSLLNVCVRALYHIRLTDEATCYNAFRTADLRVMDLACERFEFCPEVTAKACRMGLRILEVPIGYDPRTAAAGKKIRWTDGLVALATLWRWRHWQAAAKGELPSSKDGFQANREGPRIGHQNERRQTCCPVP